jgi:ankyrin repeat protein
MNKLEEIVGAVYRKDYKTLDGLVPEHVNDTDQEGRPPLMHAILAEDVDPIMVKYLIDHGADINAFDKGEQWTALHFAARGQDEAIARLLLEAGATVDPLDRFGNTPLWRCVFSTSPNLGLIRMLIAHGADIHRKNSHGMSPIDMARKMGRHDLIVLLESALQSS